MTIEVRDKAPNFNGHIVRLTKNSFSPKSLSQRCYGAAKPPHNNAEIVISAFVLFKYAL